MEKSRLVSIPLFATLDEADLELLAGVAREAEAADGETLMTEGEPGSALYAIESGTARVTLIDVPLATFGPGDVFGEMAVIAPGRRTATVVATSPMRLITLSIDDVAKLDVAAPDGDGAPAHAGRHAPLRRLAVDPNCTSSSRLCGHSVTSSRRRAV